MGVLDLILQSINARELKEFNMLVQLTCDDSINTAPALPGPGSRGSISSLLFDLFWRRGDSG